jgi:trehalose synthase
MGRSMLHTVDIGRQSLASYADSAGCDAVEEVRELARPLREARILHVSATPYGGGVAEILRSEVPLLRDLGLRADWKLITGDEAFFSITKSIHNGLQGASRELTASERELYLAASTRNAHLLDEDYDLIVVHDPQPLGMREFHTRQGPRWIWRCHIDTSEPFEPTWRFLSAFLNGYDAAVFTLAEFAPPDLPVRRIEIIPPAIDPRSPKNMPLDPALVRGVLGWIGVELDRPLITQVSRFDPWKDPFGVMAAYRLVKTEVPAVQLALVASMALDDPESWAIYRQVVEASRGDDDIHLFTNLTGVGNIEVNAFQRQSAVIIQKSIREGFGLVVSEALWKGTPVVAARAGGIPLQFADGCGGFLVDSIEACAERTLWLLHHRQAAKSIGAAGRERVRGQFLLTRLLKDELRLYASVLSNRPSAACAV